MLFLPWIPGERIIPISNKRCIIACSTILAIFKLHNTTLVGNFILEFANHGHKINSILIAFYSTLMMKTAVDDNQIYEKYEVHENNAKEHMEMLTFVAYLRLQSWYS